MISISGFIVLYLILSATGRYVVILPYIYRIFILRFKCGWTLINSFFVNTWTRCTFYGIGNNTFQILCQKFHTNASSFRIKSLFLWIFVSLDCSLDIKLEFQSSNNVLLIFFNWKQRFSKYHAVYYLFQHHNILINLTGIPSFLTNNDKVQCQVYGTGLLKKMTANITL